MPSIIDASVNIARAASPSAYPILRAKRELGDETVAQWVVMVLTEADVMCGGKTPPNVVAMWSRMVLQQFGHRSVESLCLAVRDGMMGKVYGALTYPQIAEWMNEHEARIMAIVESEGAAHKFTGDNLGSDYLDRAEHDSAAGTIRRQQSLIDSLRRKLDTNNQPKP